MTRFSLLILSVVLLLSACTNHSTERPQTAIETGRSFIRTCLDGEFEQAEKLLAKDSQNIQLFGSFKEYYHRMSDEQKKKYKQADYQINKYADLNDSTTIINYSNDYMNKPMEIKIIRQANEWSVDFKYTYSGNLPIDWLCSRVLF